MNRSLVMGICALLALGASPVLANSYTAQPSAPAAGAEAPKAPTPYTAITPPGFNAQKIAPVAPRSATVQTDTDRQLEEIDRTYKKELEAITKSLRESRKNSAGAPGTAGAYAFIDFNLKDILKKEAKKAFGDKLKVFDDLKKKATGKLAALKAKKVQLGDLSQTLDEARESGSPQQVETAVDALRAAAQQEATPAPTPESPG